MKWFVRGRLAAAPWFKPENTKGNLSLDCDFITSWFHKLSRKWSWLSCSSLWKRMCCPLRGHSGNTQNATSTTFASRLHSVPSNFWSISHVTSLVFCHIRFNFLITNIFSYLVGYIMKQEETNFFVSVTLIQVRGHIGMSIVLSGNVFPVCFPLPGHGEPEQKPILGRAYGSC